MVIVAESILHLREIASVGEIGLQNIDRDTVFAAKALREGLHANAIARYQDQIVAAFGEAVGIDRTNSG
jgi:hypothetical protein